MAPANGATGRPGQSTSRRPAGGAYKPVVPVIPLQLIRPPRHNLSVPVSSQPPVNTHPARNETAAEPDSPEAEAIRAEAKLDEAEQTTADRQHTTPPASEPQFRPEPSAPEVVTASAPPTTTVTTANDRLATPPSERSSRRDRDTPTAQSSATYSQQPVASPTPTRRRAAAPFPTFNGSQQQHPIQPDHGAFHDTGANHNSISCMNVSGPHQTHPSNGSLIFSGLHDSSTSSPVPFDGRIQPPTSMSYLSEGTAAINSNGVGLPFLVSPAFDGFPPAAFQHPQQQHGPPTPHSFHGSQSSAPPDDNGFPSYPLANGHHGHLTHPTGQGQHHMASLSMDLQSGVQFPVPNGPAAACTVSRLQAQALAFLREGIERAEFTDCTLELHLAHQPRDSSLLLPCHRFIISQSPMLHQALRAENTPAGGRLVLEPQDQYMRSDCFHFTLRTLYGWDLGDGPLPPYHPQHTVKDSFDIALGYAASASYLKLPFVYAKGIHHACHQLHWDTIEKACQYALPRAIYGRAARHGSPTSEPLAPLALVDAIMAFLVRNIPADFVLDVETGDCGFSRLPRTSASDAPSRAGPAVAHGGYVPDDRLQHKRTGSAYMPQNSRMTANPRLSSIQFGDLCFTNGQDLIPGRQLDAVGPRSPSQVDSIISRILLNLPFPMLKQVLEHPGLAKPSGELSLPSRQKLIWSVVAEREARRMAVLNRRDPQLQIFVDKLESAVEPLIVQQLGDFLVNSMGFKEEVFPGDVPYLLQNWTHGSGGVAS